MRFQIDQHLSAPLADVESALVDPRYIAHLGTIAELGSPELLSQEELPDGVRQRVRYRFMGELSGSVRRVVDPARLTWVEHSTLDRRSHRTEWQILPDHYANLLRSSGTFQLVPVDGGTVRVAEGDVGVSFPMVGGKVSAAIVSGLRRHAAIEQDVLNAWLGAD